MENNITAVSSNQDVLSEQVVAYASRFRGFAKSSVKSTLEMCVLLKDASDTLSKIDFAYLKAELCLYSESTVSKFMKIAEAAPRFHHYLDKLPQSYTTLYLLTHIDSDKFVELFDSGKLTRDSTAKDINLLSGKSLTTNTISKKKLTLSFESNITEEQLSCICRIIETLKSTVSEFSCEYTNFSAPANIDDQKINRDIQLQITAALEAANEAIILSNSLLFKKAA